MVKICKNCGQKLHENTQLCPDCGGTEFTVEEGNIQDYKINTNVITTRDMTGNGNIALGILGAFLFSLIGGVIYFVFYQIGIIAGISGLIIFYLTQFGYKKFSKCNNNVSLGGLISSIVLMIIIIFLADYVSVAFDIYRYSELDMYFFDVIKAMPELLKDEEIKSLFVEDLVFAYVFGFIATISDIIRIIKFRR